MRKSDEERKCNLLEKSCSGGFMERNIRNWSGGGPNRGIIAPNLEPFAGVDDVVARALDALARRRKLRVGGPEYQKD